MRTYKDLLEQAIEYLQETHQDEILNEHYGDDRATCTYCQLIDDAKKALAVEPDPPTVIIDMDGGLIQWIGADMPMNIIVVDMDIDGVDENEVEIPFYDTPGHFAGAVYQWNDHECIPDEYKAHVLQTIADSEKEGES
jgi:hypothetical protein